MFQVTILVREITEPFREVLEVAQVVSEVKAILEVVQVDLEVATQATWLAFLEFVPLVVLMLVELSMHKTKSAVLKLAKIIFSKS